MSILNKIFSNTTKDLVGSVGAVVDGLSTSVEEKSAAKAKLSEIVLNSLTRLAEVQGEVIKTEMQGNVLQRSWRPLVMIAMVSLLFMRWLGYTESVDIVLEAKLMDIIQFGLGGYVVGRSAEKIATTVTQNIDMPFIKKNRREI